MSEQLYIRLGSQFQHKVHWLVWSDSENEIIASGILPDAGQLNTLQSRAGGRAISVFVPGNAIITKQVLMPPKAGRQFIQALPFTLEDELAQDVDELFFATGSKVSKAGQTYLNVAICSKQQMDNWLAWLDAAELVATKLIPDYLALPVKDGEISALQLGDEWLIRASAFRGFEVTGSALQDWLDLLPKPESATAEKQAESDSGADTEAEETETHTDEVAQPVLAHYSPLPAELTTEGYQVKEKAFDLPLQVLVQGVDAGCLNMRQGIYQLKKQTWKFLSAWRNVAILAGVLFLIHMGGQVSKIYQLEQQVAQLDDEIKKTFLTAFPSGKRIKVSGMKKYVKSKMKEVSLSSDGDEFIAMLNLTLDAFDKVKDLNPESLRFDAKRNEIRIQATASNFSSFESFKAQLTNNDLKVEQGSLNNSNGKVSGSLSIKK
ncbi:type II secretion system protein GspL [Saccharobesus litoralis]|uniref:type II secretion system protein GspL n=1 Tax=Saccharobesus litoralis TaxID=2172099 RepID=UPI00131ED97A|nr:type II secretion system protein GspL [Saccharobesus litoralis]